MSFIAALIIGGVSGWLAGKIMGTSHSIYTNFLCGLFYQTVIGSEFTSD